MRLKRCKKCGRDFESDKPGGYFCPECAKVALKENVFRARQCIDCGQTFMGYPKSKRCPSCRAAINRERDKQQKKNGPRRELGSIDYCQNCGGEYTVESGRQKYCKDCAKQAVAENVRAEKRAYAAANKSVIAARKAEMLPRRKVCVICGCLIDHHSPSVTCSSEACKKEYVRRKYVKADIARGRRKSTSLEPYDSGLPKSGVVGVTYRRNAGNWQAQYKGHYIGVFGTVEDAAKAIDEYKAKCQDIHTEGS